MIVITPATDDTAIKKLSKFATDVAELADQRPDLELRRLVDHLFQGLNNLKENR